MAEYDTRLGAAGGVRALGKKEAEMEGSENHRDIRKRSADRRRSQREIASKKTLAMTERMWR